MKMQFLLLLFFASVVLAANENELLPPSPFINARVKRSATGALHIVTNNAQPIHADVKSEGDAPETPCPEGIKPSHIESGVGFKVTPPEDASYAMKSLRKSAPLHYVAPTTLDLFRSISRVITFIIVFISAISTSATDARKKRHAASALATHAQLVKDNIPEVDDNPYKVLPHHTTEYALKTPRVSTSIQYLPTALDLFRSMARVITFITIFISAVLEFYASFQNILKTMFSFIN